MSAQARERSGLSQRVLLPVACCLTLLLWGSGAGAQARPASPLAAAPPETGVRVGTAVLPETVTVGSPFRVQLRVRAPAGSKVEFPVGPDSAATLDLVDPKAVQDQSDGTATDITATYRLTAWDIGPQSLQMSDVVVTGPFGARRIPLSTIRVIVRSVLPADSALRKPKPPRPLFAVTPPWWRYWWVAAIALAILLLLWWLWRRRRARALAPVVVDPYALAEREFARVEAMGLLEAGERGRFVALMVEVLRDYLARRVPGAHPALTSQELLRALRLDANVPVERLAAVLEESDLVKFARRPVTPERARSLAVEARSVVRDVNQSVQAQAAAEAAREAARDEQKRSAA